MDAIELARQRASELHRQTVAAGHDLWAPYNFVVAAAKAQNLTVEQCAPGASILDGARAIFDSQYRLIIHENAGSLFDQAFLVAHELGHAELGDDKEMGTSQAIHIDPTRASEASPIGIERVIDYSQRQRHEVQMDLFAREFLLPRAVAKSLHVENGMTCSDIATKLNAPFDVIAQQMLDALLLPSVVLDSNPSTQEAPLNERQQIAAKHRGKALLLHAGPGTGKTRTLVARIEMLLDEGVDPRRVLVLTFSNKAASEIADRISLKRPTEAAALWIGTFHGFGLDLLRRFNDLCNLPAAPRLMDRTEAVDLLEQEFTRLDLVHYRNLYDPTQTIVDILNAISRAKDEVVGAASYLALAQKMTANAKTTEESEAAARAMEVARVYSLYEDLKYRAGCVDFGDLVMRPVHLLETNETVRQQLQAHYDHVLVDEYQDVNRSSIRLLTALKPNGTNLWAVGDAKQSIYRFRGASSFNMSRFGKQDFAEGITANLEVNYRSTPEIVGAFSDFASGMTTGETEQRLKAERASNSHSPELRTLSTGDLTSTALADCIEQMRQAGFSYRNQAVLCRGNDKLSELGQELERIGIPILFLGSLFERPEVKDLMAMLSLLVDGRAMGLVRTSCWTEFALSMEDVVSVFEHLRSIKAQPGIWMSELPGISPAGKSSLEKLRTVLQGFDSSSSPWSVLARVLLDRTRLAANISSSDRIVEQARGVAIWQFLNFARVQTRGNGLPITKLMDRIRRLVQLRDERDLRQLPAAAQGIDAVRLMTIHGSKGLEFPVVHLTGANQDTIPGSFRATKCPPPDGMVTGGHGNALEVERTAHNQEQECLFYVAMSRAKDRLFLYGATQKSNGTHRGLSEYLQRFKTSQVQLNNLTQRLPTAPEDAPLNLDFTGTPQFSSDAIALYDSCKRRFLYTHLLQIGGRRKMNAFMKMHESVREVYQAIASGRAPTEGWEGQLDAAFVRQELHEHGYADDFRGIAKAMLQYFLKSRAGTTIEQSKILLISLGAVEIGVRPDEVLIRNGIRTLRKVRTGHAPRSDSKDVGSAAFLLAAQKAFPGALVELVYLADNESRPLSMTARELGNRQSKLTEIIKDIRAGRFSAERSEFTCPSCPAFFVCGATPPGALQKSF